jgi:hypothetical protein
MPSRSHSEPICIARNPKREAVVPTGDRRAAGTPLAAPGGTIRIRIDGPFASVEPGLVGLLAPRLGYVSRDYLPGSPRGWLSRTVLAKVFTVETDGHLVTFAGMVPRIQEFLERLGYEVEILDLTPPTPRHRVDGACAAILTGEPKALARALVQNRRGLIGARGKAVIDRLVLIIRLFAEARVWIVAARRQEARQLHHRLLRRLRRPIGLLLGGLYYPSLRVVVTTVGSLDPDQADVLIFADAVEATADGAIEEMAQIGDQRVYGIVDPDLRPGGRTGFRLEGHFGRIIHSAGRRSRAAEVRVLVADAPLVHASDYLQGLDYKRQAVWHNDRRNIAIAEVAEALAAGREEALWRHGLFLSRSEGQPLGKGRRQRVAVLVESPEHGRALALRLPGWDLRTGPGGADNNSVLPTDRAILTLVHAHRLDWLDVDVLVRADGTPWPLELPGFPPRTKGRARRVLLVDFADESDEVAAAATQDRLRAYERRGWPIEGPRRWVAGPGSAEPDLSGVHTSASGTALGAARFMETRT